MKKTKVMLEGEKMHESLAGIKTEHRSGYDPTEVDIVAAHNKRMGPVRDGIQIVYVFFSKPTKEYGDSLTDKCRAKILKGSERHPEKFTYTPVQ